ncbi:GntR family transcriptional regulator [Salipiger marinus]|jgi:DNA-binding GntR family transcriptional regulator|uniref:GntR family transcriptional regulator n=1 Tax=Salipiger marinus TaxID=555512 RepID=UPI000E7ED572|nr:GntR family transcriptional regulator [Salipiger manganoxidans]MCD1619578.1 GntR family transcriptional regulator [Salipiger manganoxidans]MEB3419458.1 GntR family transcriptional regulator [Salipiger manganoxidans]HBM59223.1 GntR family transcriptional regulator [Citreicella sp.]
MSQNLDQIRPARRQTLSDQVHDTLSEMLLSGALRPRDRLSLRDLAERLEVSMMPVREAVSRLAASGALDVSPKRAVMVPLMTSDAFADLTQVRMLTEGEAARLAASRASRTEIAGILALADRFEEVLDAAYGSAAAVAANKDLHFALYRAAGSPALMEVITMLWLKAGPIINFDIGVEAGVPSEEEMSRSRTHHSRAHHRQLCEALSARDGAAAAQAIAEDIRVASDLIRAHGAMDTDNSRRRIMP